MDRVRETTHYLLVTVPTYVRLCLSSSTRNLDLGRCRSQRHLNSPGLLIRPSPPTSESEDPLRRESGVRVTKDRVLSCGRLVCSVLSEIAPRPPPSESERTRSCVEIPPRTVSQSVVGRRVPWGTVEVKLCQCHLYGGEARVDEVKITTLVVGVESRTSGSKRVEETG